MSEEDGGHGPSETAVLVISTVVIACAFFVGVLVGAIIF